MSLALRIIPRLDIKGPNLVKGINLEGLRVLGKPEHFARFYYEQGADELFFQDVVASLLGRNSLHDVISRTANEVFIPLTVGGGLRTLDDIAVALRAGADKVSLNTAVHENPELVAEAAEIFGRSTIVVCIEAIRQPNGQFEAFTDNGRNRTGRNVLDWARQVEQLGAGEILLTSVDREGAGSGFETSLAQEVQKLIDIPLVVHGGAGKPEDILDLTRATSVNGVAVASMFHYDYLNTHRQLEGYEDEGNIEFLRSKRRFEKVTPTGLIQLKNFLRNNNVGCR
jgi:imidazole glycerol-phosphate synthase subunit HisF